MKKRINADYIQAMKNKNLDRKNILSVIKGEIQTLEKNTMVDSLSDEKIIEILQKTEKSILKSLESRADVELQNQLKVVEEYLPKKLTDGEIDDIISKSISSGAKSIGEIIKLFNDLPVDKKKVSILIKNALANV